MISFLLRLSSAALLGAALFSFSLPASAAEGDRSIDGGGLKSDIVSPRDSASGLPTGRRQHSPLIDSKYDEILKSIQSLRSESIAIRAMCDELSAMLAEEEAALAEDSAAAEEMLAQIDAASTIFTEQVAPFLDEKVVVRITQELALTRVAYGNAGHFPADDVVMTDDLALLLEALAALESDIDPLEAAATQGQTTVRSRSNVRNN